MALGIKELYLIVYNVSLCSGWAIVLKFALETVLAGTQNGSTVQESLAKVYETVDLPLVLFYSQTAALLEIVHAAVGLVRSPVMVTTMQVMSRIVALFALILSPNAQNQFGAGVMIISWATVEIFRYMFYAFALVSGDATKGTPYPLFWLRYSLFAILYPTGISGELSVFWQAAHDAEFHTVMGQAAAVLVYARILPIVYFFGSPFMILNMVGNRKNAFKKRFAKPPPPPRGISWPLDDKGVRSSTNTNKEILASAVEAVSQEKADKLRNARGYRFTYVKHLTGLVQEQCASPDAALKIAEAGIAKAYELFEFIAPDGSAVSLKEAMERKATDAPFETGFIEGQGSDKTQGLEVPYKGKILKGEALKQQVQEWVDYGTIEPSAGAAIIGCVDNPKWTELSNKYFVLLGAGSAMGPLHVLLALGANVIAIDLDRPNIWKRLIELTKKSTGTITFPLKQKQETYTTDEELYAGAGCNLFTHTPLIRDWLLTLYKGKAFTVGSYAYLNGALHVQVSLAMDAIVQDLSEKRKNTSLAYLCTPTDLHLIPEEAHEAALQNYKDYSKKLICIVMRLLSRGKFLRKNAEAPVQGKGGPFYLVNGVSVAQGPNYILAKRIQHWRAIIARSKGCIVSSNIAPATSTVSVTQNRTFAWAYEGMPFFVPYEIFAPETSNAVMSALLFSDLNNAKSSGNPKTSLNNPNQLFSEQGFHGGTWRCAYQVDSIGETSVLIYFARVGAPYLVAAAAVGVAAGAKLAGIY